MQNNCESLRSEVAVAVAECFEEALCIWSFHDPNTIEPCLEALLHEHRTEALDELIEAQDGWGYRSLQAHRAPLFLQDGDVRAIARCYREVPANDQEMLGECLRAIPGVLQELLGCNS